MRNTTPLLARGLATGLMALALFGATVLPAEAGEYCKIEPRLEAVDSNGDGVASLAEIRAVAPDNTELQDQVDKLASADITGIRYVDCEASSSGTTAGGSGSGTPSASGSGSSSNSSGDGDGSDKVLISVLPSTGQGASTVSDGDAVHDAVMVSLILGATGLMTLGAVWTARRRWLA